MSSESRRKNWYYYTSPKMRFERFVSKEVFRNKKIPLNNQYIVFHKVSNDVIHFVISKVEISCIVLI